jgi:arylsulfatase A-like enzyme
LSCTGNPVLKTPELDKLHDQSVRFADFHVAPICTPTRSELLTGRDCLANSAYCVCSGHGFIRPEVPTMAGIFAASGSRMRIDGNGLHHWILPGTGPIEPLSTNFALVKL